MISGRFNYWNRISIHRVAQVLATLGLLAKIFALCASINHIRYLPDELKSQIRVETTQEIRIVTAICLWMTPEVFLLIGVAYRYRCFYLPALIIQIIACFILVLCFIVYPSIEIAIAVLFTGFSFLVYFQSFESVEKEQASASQHQVNVEMENGIENSNYNDNFKL
ncbi:hypothetical protein M3Y95_00906200 [Aphelenchoides besseyi]|nr:hypothetical protein M3Y95_00906200 [Aphelenchoides besseyi]